MKRLKTDIEIMEWATGENEHSHVYHIDTLINGGNEYAEE